MYAVIVPIGERALTSAVFAGSLVRPLSKQHEALP
jgi:hypothetical protein